MIRYRFVLLVLVASLLPLGATAQQLPAARVFDLKTSDGTILKATFDGDQWKPVAEWEMSDDLSHLQCTDLRRFRNTPTESPRRFLHSFLAD